jgi:hypothetical protein
MKKIAIIGLAVLSIAAVAVVYNESNFSARGRMYQPAPEGHLVGKDNGPGYGRHHTGEDCARCHRKGGRAEAYLWTVSGTLYADRAGSEVLKGGEIIMQDREGNVISLTSNEVGNFWTLAPIASNPFTVSAHGGAVDILYVLDAEGNLVQPADPNDPRTWLYKAWVRKGSSVLPMMTIAPVGSATGNHMSCSMHHGNMGSRGALWVTSEPTLSSYPKANLSYRKHIYPILRDKCSTCHIPGATMTRLVTRTDIEPPSTSIDYSNGLDLTNYGGSQVGGYTKQGVLSVVDKVNPEQSLILVKTVKGGLHGGGTFWSKKGPDYLAIRQWITEGAQEN